MIRTTTKFYKDLYTTKKVNDTVQNKLLLKVKTKITVEEKRELDEPFLEEEMKKTLDYLPLGKSPRLDGYPIEFYKEYWEDIKILFMGYLREGKDQGLSSIRNVSVTKLIHKRKQGKNIY